MTSDWNALLRSVVGGKYFLKKYTGEELGTGIFEADADGNVAIVRLQPANPEAAQAWGERVAVSTALDHPNLLRDFESGETRIDGNPYTYLVSEPIEERLDGVLAERVLTKEETEAVMESTLTALDHLHTHGYLHGNVRPQTVVAAEGRIKLLTDSVRAMPASETEARRAVAVDLRDTAETAAELLTRRRSAAAGVDLPSPFGDFVNASVGSSECPAPTAKQLLGVLHGIPLPVTERPPAVETPGVPVVAEPGAVPEPPAPPPPPMTYRPIEPPPPAPEPRPVKRVPASLLVGGLAALLVIVVAVAAFRATRSGVPDPAAEQAKSRVVSPSPVAPEAAPPVKPHAAPPRSVRASGGRWAVVAAIYRDRTAAVRRAEQLASKWKGAKPTVHPAEGKANRYLVVLGSGMEKKEAERLRNAARAAGMPRDSYVTQLEF